MARKTIFLIHGRSTKPKKADKEELVIKALIHGLNRVDKKAALKILNGEIDVELAYYGDINNEIMINHDQTLIRKLNMFEDPTDKKFYEPKKNYEEHLDQLFQITDLSQKKYQELLRKHSDQRFVDEITRILAPIIGNGFTKKILLRELPDLGAYINSRKVGSAIRQRLQKPLIDLLNKGSSGEQNIAIVSHSMGCIAAYDVLWKISQMSEYEQYHKHIIPLWITLGSPIGDPLVRSFLYDSNEPEDGLFPRNVKEWINISAFDDYISYDYNIEDDFSAMKAFCNIKDLPRIYNFWVDEEGCNPHKLYGYLDHPVVAQQIASWINK